MSSDDPLRIARNAVRDAPRDAMAWVVLADAELDAGDLDAGAQAAKTALQLRPNHPEALARLGRALAMSGRHAEAAQALRVAAANAPGHAGIHVWLGHALEDAGEPEAAADAYAQAHRFAPDDPQVAAYLLAWRRRLCDWRDIDALARQVRASVRDATASVEPFAFLSEDSSAAEQLRCARIRASQYRPRPAGSTPVPSAGSTSPIRPLRLGFLSNGFGAHPTGSLTVAFFESLARHHEMEIHLFALNADDGSAIRKRLIDAAHAVHDLAASPHARSAQNIHDAGIDVLFDLRGWGGGGAPEVLAMRPAPVQVNWLAFPGTSGAPWIDYMLADDSVLPAALETSFSETVMRLRRCFQPSDTSRPLPAPHARGGYGLPDSGTVFCCFNNSYKLNPASMSRNFEVLAGVPGSVLWLLSGPGQSDERLRDAARNVGIDAERLVFMPKQPQPEYLARLQCADLFLDTNPYNAHTTASDALWAGCPLLTRPGDTFAARVGGSLNHHLGLDDMNMVDDATYIATAIALGNDRPRLQALRRRVADARVTSGLFDMDAFARDFAAAAHRMSRRDGLVAPRQLR